MPMLSYSTSACALPDVSYQRGMYTQTYGNVHWRKRRAGDKNSCNPGRQRVAKHTLLLVPRTNTRMAQLYAALAHCVCEL